MRRWLFIGSGLAVLLTALLLLPGRPAGEHGATPSGDFASGDLQPDDPHRWPSEWAWQQRTFPHFRADPAAYRIALDQAEQLRLAAGKRSRYPAWVSAGPTNIGGRISDVAYDPKRPETLYAAAATGGVFKSEDDGATWAPIFDEQAVLTIGDLAVDPQRPETLYVGTGEANGGHNNFAGGGLYRSTDGGASWTLMGLDRTTSIGRIRIDPSDPDRIFVAAVGSYFAPTPDRGLYRSTDAGKTWERVLAVNDSTGVIDLIQRPDDPDVLIASTWERVRRPQQAYLYGAGSGLWRSTDGGDTWARLGPEHGLPDPSAYGARDGRVRFGRIGLALCAAQPDVMYALYNDGTFHLGLWRTDDGGDTWRQVDLDRTIERGTSSFSWYFGQVRVHPQNPDDVYVLDVGLMRSTDGGASFERISDAALHVDHHALAFHPADPDRLLLGNDGGLNRSEDGGQTWPKIDGLPITQFYEIAIDPTDPDRRFGGTQDNGTLRTPAGRVDAWEEVYGGDGFYVNLDPSDPNTFYVESQWGGLVKTSDGGTTFQGITLGIDPAEKRNWSTPVVMDPNDPAVLYYGTNRLYRTETRGTYWNAISDVLAKPSSTSSTFGTLTTIAVAPSDSDVLYVGTDDGNVWTTANAGTTWTDVTADLPYRWVTRLAIDPNDPATAYVTFSGLKWRDPEPHIFRTTDQGASWTSLQANLPEAPINALAIDPYNTDVLYVGTDVGAFVTFDGGLWWEALGSGLPAVPVYDLKIHAPDRLLVAGTHGRSMYTLDLAGTPAPSAHDADETPIDTRLTLHPAYPNPTTASTTVRFWLPAPAPVRLELYDALGRRTRTLVDAELTAGLRTFTWDGTTDAGTPAASGTYLIRLSAELDGQRVQRTGSVVLSR